MGSKDKPYVLDWYPSEYLYRESTDRYCIAIDIQNTDTLIIGGTLMRQHNFVIDVDNQAVGIAHATCSEDPNQVKSETDLILAGQQYALDPTHLDSLNAVWDLSAKVRP